MMRQIGEGGQEAGWNSRLVQQLGFIRKHLRYPVSRQTALPVVLLAASVPAVGLIFYSVLFTRSKSSYLGPWFPALLFSLMLLPAIVTALRYFRTLRFTAVPARPTIAENMLLMQQFLRAHHFAVGRHPEAPEVFQIISKNISALRDEREVVIFIADEGRILVNSHFTQNRFRTSIGVPHYREIARMLEAWIRQRGQNDKPGLRPV
jgi:hypothetical protein